MHKREEKHQTVGYAAGFLLIFAGIFLFFRAVAEIPSHYSLPADAATEITPDPAGASPKGDGGQNSVRNSYPLEIRILDVGQGLAVLIRFEGNYALYDGGGPEYTSYVINSLTEQGIESLDYLFASHYDREHTAGLVEVLKAVGTDWVFAPDYEPDSSLYTEFASAAYQNGKEIITPSPGEILTLGGAEIQILGPVSYEHKEEDNLSMGIRISYGNFSCIVTGDSEAEAEYDMTRSGLELESTVYVAGNHGGASSSSREFLSAVSPQYAVISCGKENDCGCPSKRTLNDLRKTGTRLYRTDVQGEISILTDGNEVRFSCAPTSDWTEGDYGQDNTMKNTKGE